jgi:hypothetical protein
MSSDPKLRRPVTPVPYKNKYSKHTQCHKVQGQFLRRKARGRAGRREGEISTAERRAQVRLALATRWIQWS